MRVNIDDYKFHAGISQTSPLFYGNIWCNSGVALTLKFTE